MWGGCIEHQSIEHQCLIDDIYSCRVRGCIEHQFLIDDTHDIHVISMHSYLCQDLFGSLAWVNITADSNGKVAGFVDFDWGASLCPDKACSEDMKVSLGKQCVNQFKIHKQETYIFLSRPDF